MSENRIESLAEFFAPGVTPADVPNVFPLLRARSLIDTFVTLFRGGDDEVLIRLLVLRELAGRAEEPTFTPREIKAHLTYLDPIKLDTVLGRLREGGLLIYGEDQRYAVSGEARNALAALSLLFRFSGEDDSDLGLIVTQVAGLEATGGLNEEALAHLLSRLSDLYGRFEAAIASGSEIRVRKAQSELESVWKWVQEGTRIIHRLAEDTELSTGAARIVQRIGLAQSRLARIEATFQRTLNQMAVQRVHLGASGLSSSDVSLWLTGVSQERLVQLLDRAVAAPPQPVFLSGADDLGDVAETELVDRIRERDLQTAMPAATRAPTLAVDSARQLDELDRFAEEMRALAGGAASQRSQQSLAAAIVAGSYAESAYRFSLSTVLGDASIATSSDLRALADLQLRTTVGMGRERVGYAEVAEISTGSIGMVAMGALGAMGELAEAGEAAVPQAAGIDEPIAIAVAASYQLPKPRKAAKPTKPTKPTKHAKPTQSATTLAPGTSPVTKQKSKRP